MRQLLVVTLCLFPLLAAGDDPAGWTRAKWGMTEAQLAEAFPGQLATWSHPDQLNHSRIGLDRFEIGTIAYKVQFCPDADGRLSSVILAPIDLSDMNEVVFQKLEQLLVEKYGRPYKAEDGVARNRQWTFQTTVIELALSSIPGTRQRLLHVEYRHKSSDLDKV